MPEHVAMRGYFIYQIVAITVKGVWERSDRGNLYYEDP